MFSSINVGACIIYHDEYDDIATHWVAICVKGYDAFRAEHIPEKLQIYIEYKHMIQ